MTTHDFIGRGLRQFVDTKVFTIRDEMSWLSQTIENHLDAIMTTRYAWKFSDEIHSYVFRLPYRDLGLFKQTWGTLMFVFDLGAGEAFGDKSGNVLFHVRPPILKPKIQVHLICTGMDWIIRFERFAYDEGLKIATIGSRETVHEIRKTIGFRL